MWTLIIIIVLCIIGYNVYRHYQDNQADEAEDQADAAAPQEAGQVRLRRTRLNRKWRTVNSWSSLIKGANGKQDLISDSVKKALVEVAAPNLGVEHRKISLSGLSGMFAGSRKQLVIENKALRGYHVFVSVEDYGKQLSVSWYLMLRENWLTRLLQMTQKSAAAAICLWPVVFVAKIFYSARSVTIPELMNMFDLEELTAYSTTVHHAVTGAVEALMGQMNMDFSKVDTKSRGFLNLS